MLAAPPSAPGLRSWPRIPGSGLPLARMATPSGRTPRHRSEQPRCRQVAPAHTPAAPGWWPALQVSGDAPPAPRAIAQSLLGSPSCRLASRRCAVAPATPWTLIGPNDERPPARPNPAPATARSPPARQTTGSGRRAASTSVIGVTALARLPSGTSVFQLAAIFPPPSPRPRSTSHRRSTPRTVVGPLAAPPRTPR